MKFLNASTRILALLCAIGLSCHKDNTNITANEQVGSPVQAVFAGRITSENGVPLNGATVIAGTATTTTDVNGVFRLDPVRLPSRNAIVQVKQPGYFDFSRAYNVEDGALLQVDIQLLSRNLVQSFQSAQGGTAQAGAVHIDFSPNSIANADGSIFSGSVYVYVNYLDPTDANLNRRMPGDLRGINAKGEAQTLATFGMIGVQLTTPDDKPLQLEVGQTAEITIPIPAGKLAAAPAEIPLWYYDPEKARWLEEGSAQKTGSQYVGKVKHFSFWNFDTGFPLIHLSGKALIGANQSSLAGAMVQLTILSSGYTGFATTDANGFFGGAVPKDETMQLDVFVYDQCGNQSLYTQTVGPFSEDASLAPFVVSGPDIHAIPVSGRLLNCDQQPVAQGYVLIGGTNSTQIILAGKDGIFDQTITWCDSNGDLTITGFDADANKQSDPLTYSFPVSAVQTGDIAVCQPGGEFITIAFNGEIYTFFAPHKATHDDTSTAISALDNTVSFLLLFSGFGHTGTLTLLYLSMTNAGSTILVTHQGTATVTNYGAIGEIVSGSANGMAQDANGQTFPFSCVYRVIRGV